MEAGQWLEGKDSVGGEHQREVAGAKQAVGHEDQTEADAISGQAAGVEREGRDTPAGEKGSEATGWILGGHEVMKPWPGAAADGVP